MYGPATHVLYRAEFTDKSTPDVCWNVKIAYNADRKSGKLDNKAELLIFNVKICNGC